MSQEQQDLDLIEKLKKQPKLFARVQELLSVVENAGGDLKKAAAAEKRVIEEIRQMGHEALSAWARVGSEKASEEASQKEGVRRAGKKNSGGTARSGLSK